MIEINPLDALNVGSNVATAFIAGMVYMKVMHLDKMAEENREMIKKVRGQINNVKAD